jgi:hypothetical protein
MRRSRGASEVLRGAERAIGAGNCKAARLRSRSQAAVGAIHRERDVRKRKDWRRMRRSWRKYGREKGRGMVEIAIETRRVSRGWAAAVAATFVGKRTVDEGTDTAG